MMEAAHKFNSILQEVPTKLLKRIPLRLVHGVPLRETIAENWRKVEQFQARPDDLLISSYPKAGTTWMQEIVDLINNGGDLVEARRAPTHVRFPFLEMVLPPPVPSGVDALAKAPSPRVIKTHLPIQLVPKSFWEQNCKVIYIARNPKDSVVSFYFFEKIFNLQPEPGQWEQYLQNFMDGKLSWGSWYQHVRGYWDKKDTHRMLYMFYEDIKENPAREIRKVMEFLEVDLSPDVLENIVHYTSFKAMKENPMANYSTYPDALLNKRIGTFMRKGEIGDWKNHFTVSQNKAFNEDYKRKMAGTTLTFRMEK
ncbi:sulfotransferase 1C1-like [Lissotriton helveticus]